MILLENIADSHYSYYSQNGMSLVGTSNIEDHIISAVISSSAVAILKTKTTYGYLETVVDIVDARKLTASHGGKAQYLFVIKCKRYFSIPELMNGFIEVREFKKPSPKINFLDKIKKIFD